MGESTGLRICINPDLLGPVYSSLPQLLALLFLWIKPPIAAMATMAP